MEGKVELEQYMLVLPSEERKLLQEFLAQLQNPDASLFSTQTVYLTELLIRLPYPTLQILNICYERDKLHISKAISDALEQFLLNPAASKCNFISFLTNLPLNILEVHTLRDTLQQQLKIAFLKATSARSNNEICLALLSHTECKLLSEVLISLQQLHWQRCSTVPISKEFVLLQAHEHKLHFVPLLGIQLKQLAQVSDVAVRNNLLILKVVSEFSNVKQTLTEVGNIAKWLEAFSLTETPADLVEVHKFFYDDFQRMCCILGFLQKYPKTLIRIKLGALLQANSILELLMEHEMNISYEETRRFIEGVYKWHPQLPHTKCFSTLELEVLNYYAALANVFDVILADAGLSSEHYYSNKMQQLQTMLRQMRNLDILCALIEDIFQLVFLRWEHLRRDSNTSNRLPMDLNSSRKYQPKSSDTDESSLSSATEDKTVVPTLYHGFVCRGRALHSIYTLLKNFTTRKLHSEDYKQSSERVQLRFQRIIDIISEALWKYSVLEKIDESLSRAGTQPQQLLEAEELLQLVRLHTQRTEKTSSDDDSRDRSNYTSFTRRKAAKKRRRSTFSGASLSSARAVAATTVAQRREHANMMSVSTVQDATDPVVQRKAREMVARLSDSSVIPKMLSSPENLAIMALSLNNLNDVKYIIETFNLQNSEMNRELSFVEQQQQVKEKLANIYSNYQQQEQIHDPDSSGKNPAENQKRPKATVEQIKQVAAKGFEVSKIISVIDNFAQTQRLQQTPEQKQLILRYASNAQYSALLRQFEERNLNALIICDLILNLPFNREITTNILLVIRRQQQIAAGIFATASSSREDGDVKSLLPSEMGAMPLLENLCECLRLLENKQSLQQLLYDNYYSLRPRKLAAELQRERAFRAVFHKPASELGRCEQLKACTALLQQLHSKCNYYSRFCAYVAHLVKLLQLRDPNLQYHTSQLLKIDPCRIIGELIFECNMTPLEIEANVVALNLNLVHVIALNICPELKTVSAGAEEQPMQHFEITAAKEQTVLNYIANQNRLLAFLLQGVLNYPQLGVEKTISPIYLQNYLELPEVEQFAALFGGNRLKAALRSDRLSLQQINKLDSKLKRLEIISLEIENRGPQQIASNEIDQLIAELITDDAKNIQLVAYMKDVAQRARLIQENFTKIATTRLAKELIEHTLQHKEATRRIPRTLRVQLEHTLADITVYAKVSEVLQFETWPQAYDFGLKTPSVIFQKLLQMHLYKLCYKWCNVVKLAERFAAQKRTFLDLLLQALLELHDEEQSAEPELNHYLLQILETFSVEDCVAFLDAHKDRFRSLLLLQYAVDFLARNSRSDSYKNYKISLRIFEQFSPGEREHFWSLLKYPLLIVEQLVMNAKFELLGKVLQSARQALMQANGGAVCSFCFDKPGHLYDIRTKSAANNSPHTVNFHLGAPASSRSTKSAFILLNFNLYQPDHVITNECIDLLLRIYATKALDYHIAESNCSWERISQTTDMQQSLDSLCGAFQMPKVVPAREDWVRDEEATHCMCCRRTAFTMLMRRHHCRRCGRVVCFACSTHRVRLPETYADVEVRICNDCQHHIEEAQTKLLRSEAFTADAGEPVVTRQQSTNPGDTLKWQLSGNITHDKLLREEFCYEHAPSVALCLSILAYHLGQEKCIDLLLHHCHQLEKLIVPNPEVDYELVAKMMNCLALAAKVRGGPAELETIREHSEIILSVVQYGCEALIPPGPLSDHSLRKLADSLVQAEKWQLALEVHLKFGFPTAGVMAAHGLSCLRAGCFDTAREKFSHCMVKLSNDASNSRILKCLTNPSLTDLPHAVSVGDTHSNSNKESEILKIKRPSRGPALLQEILKIIESIPFAKPQPETLQRASIIRNSNTSLVSLLSRRKDTYMVPLQEPALNVLTTLANLNRISKGHYTEGSTDAQSGQPLFRLTRGFEECMHYVLNFGSHADILQFLMRHKDLKAALKYVLLQQLDAELFIHHIFLVCLRSGMVPTLIDTMLLFDERLLIWRQALFQTCRYLETQNLLHSLYQLQILLKDPVRASMTCVKFYSMNCESYQQLHANAEHLQNAQRHLQAELEIAQWETVMPNEQPTRKRKGSVSSRRASVSSVTRSLSDTFLMQMTARALNGHINTILKQMDVTKFLANCEKENSIAEELITEKVLKEICLETRKKALPTLFDSLQERTEICILVLLCGKNIEEGFGLAYRIIDAYKLNAMKVFASTAKYLARNQRLPEVEKLLACITSNNGTSTRDLDELLSVAINSAINCHEPEQKATLDNLTKRINNVEMRISCHIFIGQLKSAYLLANRHNRLNDIRRIMRQAELTNQVHIKKLCERKLNLGCTQTEEL